MRRLMLFIVAFVLGSSVDVRVDAQQTPAPEATAPTLDPKACADRERLALGDARETQGSAAPREDLSNKLARTDGVICPPAELDAQINVPPPAQGRTPVIPPPGSPGGDQSVQPK